MQLILQSADNALICRWNNSSISTNFLDLQIVCNTFALQIIIWSADICHLQIENRPADNFSMCRQFFDLKMECIFNQQIDLRLQIECFALQIIFRSADLQVNRWHADDSLIWRWNTTLIYRLNFDLHLVPWFADNSSIHK